MTRALLARPPLPDPVLSVARRLDARGHDTHLVGECLGDLLAGRPRHHYSVCTAATPDELATLFVRAVPTRADGAAWQLPTTAGPVDLLPRGVGSAIADVVALRGLTVLAMAWSPLRDEWVDPYDGRSDLAAGLLRSVGPPEAALDRAPRLALEIVRLVGRHGDAVDPALAEALATIDETRLDGVPAVLRGRLLQSILAAPNVADAVSLMARTGLAAALGVRSKPDSPALLEHAPDDLAIRFAIWLRGSRPGRFFRRHRIRRELGDQVIDLLAAHPLERSFSPRRRVSLERLERIPAAQREALIWLRGQELDAESDRPGHDAERRDFDALIDAFRLHLDAEAKRRRTAPLAIGGREVMETLGIDPGPRVGEALAWLRARVTASTEANEPAALRAALREWVQTAPPGRSRPAQVPADGDPDRGTDTG